MFHLSLNVNFKLISLFQLKNGTNNRQYEVFSDLEDLKTIFQTKKNGLKVENLFVILKQNDIIMTAHNNSKMLSNAKMIFRRRKLKKIYGVKQDRKD